jgi:putative oxidoreductase
MSLDAPDPVPTVDVAAALIEQDGRYLIARRRDDAVLGGFWEFPGGKRRTGESLQACLVREVREELGVEVTVGELWERVVHAYPHATVALYVFQGILVGGVPRHRVRGDQVGGRVGTGATGFPPTADHPAAHAATHCVKGGGRDALLRTDDAWSSLVLRVILGVVMFPHGAQKIFGWFGGNGFSGTMGFFTTQLNIPAVVAFLVIMAESVGAVMLVAGAVTRFAAFGIACVMVGAIWLVHLPNGFFMNWSGKQAGEGYEYHLLMLAMSIALMIAGGGKWSVDRAITTNTA